MLLTGKQSNTTQGDQPQVSGNGPENLFNTGEKPAEATISASAANNFSIFNSGIVTQGGISANLTAIKEKAEQVLKGKTDGINILVLDKDIDTELAYSSLVFYRVTDKVRYFIYLIAGSGRDSLTAKETVKLAENAAQDKSGHMLDEMYVFSDAVDKFLHKYIVEKLAPLVPAGSIFQPLDGIIPPYDIDVMAVIEPVAHMAANAIRVDELRGMSKGLNIDALKNDIKNPSYKFSIETIPAGVILDRVGTPVRATFAATLEVQDTSARTERSVNKKSKDKKLVTAFGYVSSLPVWNTLAVDQLGRPAPQLVMAPHVIITNIRSYIPDTPSALLGVVCGSLVATNKQYIKVLLDTMTDDNHPGLLNLVTKSVVDEKGVADIINIVDRKRNPNEKALAIDNILTHNAIVSVDVTALGDGSDALQSLTWAREYSHARAEVIQAANILTNNQFGNYSGNIIFSKTEIPGGYFSAKGKVCDIREFELEKLLSITKGQDDTALAIYMSSVNKDNQNSYNNKIELLANYIPDAHVTSKIARLTLEPDFIKSVIGAVNTSGLVSYTDNAFVMPTEGFNAQYLGAYANYSLDNAGAAIIYNNNPVIGVANYNPYNQMYFRS